MKKTDSIFQTVCLVCAVLAGLLMLLFFVQLGRDSADAWKVFGWHFIFSKDWNPSIDVYGALPSIIGTLVTTAIALILALPLSFAAALFLVDLPPLLEEILSNAIDLLAAIPSVIYGMWGLFVLAPLMQQYGEPFLLKYAGFKYLPFISNETNGFGLLTSGVILAIMILPYISAIMRDVFQMTPSVLRESAYGMGCTKYEVVKDIVLRYGIRGILGGVFIGLGRALGETMAVLFVIGNRMDMPAGIFDSATTIASTLANNFAEASGLQRSSLFALGLILLLMSFSIQLLAQWYLYATSRNRGEK